MPISKLFSLAALLCALCLTLSAADVTGKWKAEFQTPDGSTRTTTFTFKVDGAKLTGVAASSRGDAEIKDGRVNGDEISFYVVRKFGDNEMKLNYAGKVSGSEIKFKLSMEGADQSFDMVAKKVE